MEGTAELRANKMSGIAADEEKAVAGAIRKLENITPDGAINRDSLDGWFFNLQVAVVSLNPIFMFRFASPEMEYFPGIKKRPKDFTCSLVND